MAAFDYPDPVVFHREIGAPPPPDRITQEAFDYDQTPLEALVARRVGDGPCPELLYEYALDLKYTEPLQVDLMAHVLPICLETWQDQIRTNRPYGSLNEQLHAALAARPGIIEQHLGPATAGAFFAFQRQSLLALMANESSLRHTGMNTPPYTWVSTLAAYGTFGSHINELLAAWDCGGAHAVAWIQYVSALVFDEQDNPVFDPWTSEDGGGPPVLWEYDSCGFGERWSDAGVDALRLFLEFKTVVEYTRHAFAALKEHPHRHVAGAVLRRVLESRTRLERRVARLCEILATPSGVSVLDWDDS